MALDVAYYTRHRALDVACGGYYILYVRLGTLRTPNSDAIVLIAATGTWADNGATQLQDVAIVATVRSRRPIAAVRPPIIRRRTTEVAGVEEVIRVTS